MAIARKALARKTGARGLRSIMEQSLIDTMFDLRTLDGVAKVVLDEHTIEDDAKTVAGVPRAKQGKRLKSGAGPPQTGPASCNSTLGP
jgi:ATP-dependent protease Clp ATPase subunit